MRMLKDDYMARQNKVPRYRPEAVINVNKPGIYFHLDKNGAWCHWSDVAPYITEVKNQRTTAKGSPRRKAAAASV